MKYIAWIFAALLPNLVWAQEQPPQNPNTFGRWEITTTSGMRGSVVIDGLYCHYSLVSSFASIQSRCQSAWYEGSNILMILPFVETGNRNSRAFTVPDYQPGPNNYSSTQQQYSVGDSTFSFHMTTFGRGWMKGHLLGSSEHDTVTLRRH
jgi:hypothetical protein